MEEEIVHAIMVLENMLRRAGNRSSRRLGATQQHWKILAMLVEAGLEGIPLCELGRRLDVTKGNVTGLIDRMEKRGLVRRKRDPRDRRVIRALATLKGIRILVQARPAESTLWRQLFSVLTYREKKQLKEMLDRLIDRLHKIETAESPR